ncbi:MAG: MucB/RseB C-terminal domain-containing protein [Burkholderiales bacterium]|nr:MucB/RseB C-terminal domain-containing protein [Burkholderiales bacterium]
MGTAHARQLPVSDPAVMLQKMSDAARTLNYSGTFIHSNADSTTTSRVTHLFDRGDEWERVESIDGPRQETIRRNDEIYCFQPDSKTVRLDRRMTGKFFPSLVSGTPDIILANYKLRLGKVERIGGHDCQWVILEPKDALRFLQKLCAEVQTGLLMRAKTLNERGQIVEQFSFTQLLVGKAALREAGLSQLKARVAQKEPGWQTDDAAHKGVKVGDTGWWVQSPPIGFRLITELKRTMPGKTEPVSHLVFSDGLAAISVFIEPLGAKSAGFSRAGEEGMVSYAMRSVGNHQVTVLGEVPVSTAQSLANNVAARNR